MVKVLILLPVVALLAVLVWAHWPGPALAPGLKADRILVEKSARTLTLLNGTSVLKRYSVSLGHTPVGPKEREGDQKTPEGVYRIIEHKRDSSFHLALRVSYPEPADLERARAAGVKAGSDIMVHGLPNGRGFIGRAHRAKDWTAGCVAVTNPEIEEIFAAVADGTPIEIRP